MPIYSSEPSDNNGHPARWFKWFDRRRPLHGVFGGGRVADILLWRNKKLSLAILVAVTTVWFLFEVVEYHFITLISYIVLVLMAILFIWSNIADLVCGNPPEAYRFLLSEAACRSLFRKINILLLQFYEISCGQDPGLFFAAIAFLWMLSVAGNYVSSLTLLYLAFLCVVILPALYERYQNEVDHLVGRGRKDAQKLYKKLDSKVLRKIPRGPVK